jgi:hypothetical protein
LRAEEEERHKGLPTQKRKCFIKSAPGLEAGVEVAEPGHRLVREVNLETAVLPLLKMFRAQCYNFVGTFSSQNTANYAQK